MARVVIPYAARAAFRPYHERTKRWSVIVAHRRAGKTVATVNDLIRRAALCDLENPRFAYIAPLFNQAKDVVWAYLKHFAAPVLASAPNESELRVDLINGARVRLYGADNPDRLRGIYLDGVVLDEYADMNPSMWGEVIRPLLTDRQGSATFIGTPKGRNAFYDLFQRGDPTSKDYDHEWLTVRLRASETGILPPDELEAARKDMTPEQYEQEFECSFEAAILGAYFGKEIADAERTGRVTSVPYDPSVPVQTAWDLGLNDSTAIWFWQAVGPEIHVIDFYQNHGQQFPHYAAVLHAKPYQYGTHWMPHDVRAKVIGMERSRIETLIGLGIVPRVLPAQNVMDEINAARVVFGRVWFDAQACAVGLEALRQYRAAYDEKKRKFEDHPLHDWTSHAADAFRYLASAWREIAGPVEKPKPVIRGLNTLTFDEMIKRQERLDSDQA